MTVPTSPYFRMKMGMLDGISNFGSFPPTVAFCDAFKADGILLNLRDPAISTPAALAAQIVGIRSHQKVAGVWHPVPPSGDDAIARASWIHSRIADVDLELGKQGQPKLGICWLNFENYSIQQWQWFLWGKPGFRGWRGVNGTKSNTGGLRSGFATGFVDMPGQDGSVRPHADLMTARIMYAVEAFYGPTAQWPDMTPADHWTYMADRLQGRRADGTIHGDEAYPIDQLVGCYDAALGAVVRDAAHGIPAEPLLIRSGLLFTCERARNVGLI
jgi:hypothetical protein